MSQLVRVFIALLISFLTLIAYGQSLAVNPVNQFSSELHALESKQVLQLDRPFKYSDSENGAALKKLLNPERAPAVVDAYATNMAQRITDPDVIKQLDPIVQRYQTAFNKNGREYENEYLDCLLWSARILELSTKVSERSRTTDQQPAKSSGYQKTKEDEKLLAAMQGMMASVQQMMISMKGALAKGIRDDAGAKRALDIANQISPLPATK